MAKSGKILIVDDSDTNLFLLQGLLEDEGYSVTVTGNPKEGLAYIEKGHNVVLILLDIMMPGMDGFEFLEQLSERNKLSEIPVIMVTARDDRQSQEKALNMGASNYMVKPLNIKKVINTIRQHLK